MISALRIGQSAMASEPSRMVSGLAVGAGRSRCQVVAADDDGRLDLPLADQSLNFQPGARSLAIAQPADAGGQALELDTSPAPF